ncbi:carbohydrate kinase family protein [Mycolicibacterium elephantis]
MQEDPKVLVVGHLTLDTMCDRERQSAHFDVPQGAALGAAAGAAVWGANVSIITVLGLDYPKLIIETLANHGVKILPGVVKDDSLRFWVLREGNGISTQVPHIATKIMESTPQMSICRPLLKDSNFSSAHLCPMPLKEQIVWAENLRSTIPIISVDPQPFSYAAAGSDPEEDFKKLLRAVTILSITPDRFPHLAGSPTRILDSLMELGPRVVTLKMGKSGSFVASDSDPSIYEIPSLPVTVVDETGAGDAYAGSFLANFTADRGLLVSAKRATATATNIIERVGMTHILDEKDRINQFVRDVGPMQSYRESKP